MTWILLRGLTREHRHWGNFSLLLQSVIPQAKIITPDIPGSGNHYKQTCPGSIKDILEFIRADIKIQQLNKPVHILGLSLGAMIGIEWLRQYPQECATAVLMNTSLKGLNPFYQRLRAANYWKIINGLFVTNDIRSRENSIFNLTCNQNKNRDTIINDWVSYASEHPVSKRNALRQLIAATKYRIPEQKPEPPILLLSSLADHLVNPQCSQSLALHWSLPLKSHPTAGHDLTHDDAAWVCEGITKWLLQTGKSSSQTP